MHNDATMDDANSKGGVGNYGTIPIRDEQDPLLTPPATNPYLFSSLWSQLSFGWLSPILELGNLKGKLDVDDLQSLPLPFDDQTRNVSDVFTKCWKQEHDRAVSKNVEPNLVRALWAAFHYDFLVAGILKFVHDLLQFVGPQVLRGLIEFLRTPDAPLWQGLGLTVTVTIAQILMSFSLRHYFFKCYRTGLRIRTAIITAVYNKALVVTGNRKSVGKITNLISVDAQRLQDLTTYLHSMWYSVLQIALAIYFLWLQLGVSILAGLGIIVMSVPLTAISAGSMGRFQKALMSAKDKRVEVNNEVLGNMKIVKLQAWEKAFQDKLLKLRDTELYRLFWYLVVRVLTFITFSAVPLLISLGTFGTYVALGNSLDVANALTALALFDIIRFPLYMFPSTINSMVEANVSIQRINDFLTSPEHKNPHEGSLQDVGVEMSDASFVYDNKRPQVKPPSAGIHNLKAAKDIADAEWELKLLREQLQDAESKLTEFQGRERVQGERSNLLSLARVNVSIGKGELIAVVGSVGCGKSTLLKALMGEVRHLSGSVQVKGKVAYASQNAFIMNATVKENILFGKPDDNPELYKTAIRVCALNHDLTMLPQGDLTEIGEKGITLSGGQKSRLGMARAFYHGGNDGKAIFLLDDPLAAVDANVGRQMFDDCVIDGMLGGNQRGSQRTVILVTNALQYLSHPHVNKIVVLKEGSVIETGTYQTLSTSDSQFKKYLESFNESRFTTGGDANGKSDDVTNTIKDGEPEVAKSVRESLKEMQSLSLEKGKLMTDELNERETGSVSLKVYIAWVRAAGGFWVIGMVLLCYVLSQASTLLSNWWLTYWSRNADDTVSSQIYFLEIYGVINVVAILLTVTSSVVIMGIALIASRQLFRRVLNSTMHAPMSFFDTTPLGRIINRFSKDIYTVDEGLPNALDTYLFCMLDVVVTMVVVSAVTPIFTICLIPIIYVYRYQQRYFTTSYRELKRLDSVQRSPVYALFGETLDGVSTIRAFQAEKSLFRRMVGMLDNQQHAYFLTTCSQCWLAVRLEVMGTAIVFIACLSAVLFPRGDAAFAGLAGLSISYALSSTQSLNWAVRVSSDFEATMVSVERLEQYVRLPSESPRETAYDATVDTSWPEKGEIEFKNVHLRYRPDLPLVLKGLNLKLPSHSKTGIVGRTGAGKSTLMTALMRVVEVSTGQILIDGVDSRLMGLQRVRSKIAVIPQDPVLFSGTIGSNLDPFEEYGEKSMVKVLERVGLMDSSSDRASVKSLEDEVLETGNNFSVGQRQLLVIARALLVNASIIICDEATASVDAETDAKMQQIFRTDFANATCLTVAHRLNTIMDSDYVLVMDDGKAAEFDSPSNLLAKSDGIFKQLVDTWEKEHS